MHTQHITSALLILLIPVMAVPVQDKKDASRKECPKETFPLLFRGQDNPLCLRPGQICIDAYADFNFKGKVFSKCTEQNTCVNIPQESGVWGQVSSFKQKGKTSMDDGKSPDSKVACIGFNDDTCTGDRYFWFDRWQKRVFKGYKFGLDSDENDEMKSYICFNPVDWPWGRPNNAPPLSHQ